MPSASVDPHDRHLEHVRAGRERALRSSSRRRPGCRAPTGSRRSTRRSSDRRARSRSCPAASATARPRGAMMPVRSLGRDKRDLLAVRRELRRDVHARPIDDRPHRAALDGSPRRSSSGTARGSRRPARPRIRDLLAVRRPREAVDVLIGGGDDTRGPRPDRRGCTPQARRRRTRADLVRDRRRRRTGVARDVGEILAVGRPLVRADAERRRRSRPARPCCPALIAEDLRPALLRRPAPRCSAVRPPPHARRRQCGREHS